MEYHVKVLPAGSVIRSQPGAVLLDALRKAGFLVDAPCGGQGTCGKCKVTVDGKPVRSCSFRVDRDLTVELPRQEKLHILESGSSGLTPEKAVGDSFYAAFDIGTTTLVCVLMDDAGKTVAAESMTNPQTAFGADVVSRIGLGMKGHGDAMTGAVRAAMEALLTACCKTAGCAPDRIRVISVVGNPCMQQLFLGVALDNLATVPFAPVITQAKAVSAGAYLPMCAEATLLIVPDLSGFVGADTVGGILAAGLRESEDTVLLVDIGTNGEMVLSHKGRTVACSTAAGPALEGANIQFGMRAAAGAIDHMTKENIHVIGGGRAKGICGSGLVDAVAVMLETGALNRRGRVQTENRKYSLTEEVYLTQEDIRQVQLAKGAIAAGIQLMAAHLGIGLEEIDRCILAGAFGSYMDPDHACRIGLLPEQLRGKTVAGGNLALEGAKLLAADKAYLPLAQRLIQDVEVLELASLPDFRRCFAQNMFFREDTP